MPLMTKKPVRVTVIAAKFEAASEPGLTEAKKLSGWPADCCFDTCVSILRDLKVNMPKILFKQVSGLFVKSNGVETGHVWIRARRRGRGKPWTWIIDPTAGQFLSGPAFRVFTRSSKEWKLYKA